MATDTLPNYDAYKLASPSEHAAIDPPEGYVTSDEYQCRVHDAADDALVVLRRSLGKDSRGVPRVEWGDLTSDDAYVCVYMPVRPASARQVHCGVETYYDFDAADYDIRPDILAGCQRVLAAVARDMQERPTI